MIIKSYPLMSNKSSDNNVSDIKDIAMNKDDRKPVTEEQKKMMQEFGFKIMYGEWMQKIMSNEEEKEEW